MPDEISTSSLSTKKSLKTDVSIQYCTLAQL